MVSKQLLNKLWTAFPRRPLRLNLTPYMKKDHKFNQRYLALAVVSWFVPLTVALAAAPTYKQLVKNISASVLNPLIPVLFGIGLVLLLIGMVQYIQSGAKEADREKGKKLIVWGIVSLAVMLTAWGWVKLLSNTLFFPADLASPPTDIYRP